MPFNRPSLVCSCVVVILLCVKGTCVYVCGGLCLCLCIFLGLILFVCSCVSVFATAAIAVCKCCKVYRYGDCLLSMQQGRLFFFCGLVMMLVQGRVASKLRHLYWLNNINSRVGSWSNSRPCILVNVYLVRGRDSRKISRAGFGHFNLEFCLKFLVWSSLEHFVRLFCLHMPFVG